MTDAREDPWRLRTHIEASRERHASRRKELRTGAKRSRPIVDGVLHALPSAPPPPPGEAVKAAAADIEALEFPSGRGEGEVMFHDVAVCATDAVCEDVKRVMRIFAGSK